MRKWLLTALGVLLVGLAMVGVVVPLLPTTPFLLLAAACFVRSSTRLHRWLLGHRIFGPTIRNYQEHHGITRRDKIIALTLLWAVIALSAFAFVDHTWARIAMAAVAGGVTVYILSLKTVEPDHGEDA